MLVPAACVVLGCGSSGENTPDEEALSQAEGLSFSPPVLPAVLKTSTNVSFYISGKAPCTLTPYETSATKNVGQGSVVPVSYSRLSMTLTGQSVTTFVGTP